MCSDLPSGLAGLQVGHGHSSVRERGRECVREREREREGVCVGEREREREGVCGREGKIVIAWFVSYVHLSNRNVITLLVSQ